jgi:probable HAF family extracellular repeat protein
MQPIKVTSTPPTPVRFTHPGKLGHAYTGLLPLLTLCLALPAWSQTMPGLRGPGPHPFSAITPAGKLDAVIPASSHEHDDQYQFITLDIPGSSSAVANGISNNRLVTGYYQDAKSQYHGFVWQDGHVETVNYPGAAVTVLYGVSNKDVAIGYYADSNAQHAVTYSIRAKTWAALPDILDYPNNEGYGINDYGVAVGNAFDASFSASVAWIWDPATLSYSFFTVPGALQYYTFPSGLNDKGQVAGYSLDQGLQAFHGFLKEYGTYTIINMPGAPDTYPDGINNEGVIQGQIFDATFMADGFLGTPGGRFTTVNYPGPKQTAIVGINDRGDLCGGYGNSPQNLPPYSPFVALLQ